MSALNFAGSMPSSPASATTASAASASLTGGWPGAGHDFFHSADWNSLYLPCFAEAHAAWPDGMAGSPWMTKYFATTRTSFGYSARSWSTVGATIAQYGQRNS